MSSGPINIQVSVVLVHEAGSWVAQGLEYDIAAQGKTIEEAKKAFERTVVSQIVLDIQDKKYPLQGIAQAPAECWQMFDAGQRLAEQQKPFRLPDFITPNFMINAMANGLSVYA